MSAIFFMQAALQMFIKLVFVGEKYVLNWNTASKNPITWEQFLLSTLQKCDVNI